MKLLPLIVLVMCVVAAMTAPTTESQCVPHGGQCDPSLQEGAFRGAHGPCCWNYEWCMGRLLEDGSTVHMCVPILP